MAMTEIDLHNWAKWDAEHGGKAAVLAALDKMDLKDPKQKAILKQRYKDLKRIGPEGRAEYARLHQHGKDTGIHKYLYHRFKMEKITGESSGMSRLSLATAPTGDEIDLDWSAWNEAHRGEVKRARGAARRNGVSLKERAAKPGHFRAKAIMAAKSGDMKAAKKFQAKYVAKRARRMSKPAAARPATTTPPAVHSAPKPPPTRPRRVPKSKRTQALAIRAHAAAQRANRDLSNGSGSEVDLGFRYRHGWIKIGPDVGSENAGMKGAVDAVHSRKAKWEQGKSEGAADAKAGKRAKVDAADTSLYAMGYQRGYTEAQSSSNSKAVAQEFKVSVDNKREMAKKMRRIAAKDAKPSEARKILGALKASMDTDPYGHEGLGAKVGKANASVRKPGDPFRIDPATEKSWIEQRDPTTMMGKPRGPKPTEAEIAAMVKRWQNATTPKKKSKAKDLLARLKADQPVIGTWL